MKKRAAPLFLAVLTACALACPALAAEAPSPEATPSVLYPVEVLEYTEGDRAEPRISKTYELSPMDDPALIPTGDFERSGCLYTLLDIVKEDQTETDSKYYTETVTLDSKSKDMEEIMPLLAATCEAVTEDGYTGLLTLDTASIQVEASGYYQADKVHQGALPVPVRLMMDEFCNVSLPDDFGKLQATMRSRNIMSTIVCWCWLAW